MQIITSVDALSVEIGRDIFTVDKLQRRDIDDAMRQEVTASIDDATLRHLAENWRAERHELFARIGQAAENALAENENGVTGVFGSFAVDTLIYLETHLERLASEYPLFSELVRKPPHEQFEAFLTSLAVFCTQSEIV